MHEDRSDRARDLYHAVRDLAPEWRSEVLAEECAGDAALRAEVDAMLLDPDAPTGDVAATPWPDRLKNGDTGSAAEDAARHLIGDYQIIRRIGRGGMGVVYLAKPTDGSIARHVALKLMKRGMDTEDVLRRFDLERRVLASLNHPGIARLYDAGETADGLPYFVMEYVDGVPLTEYADFHRLHTDERLDLFVKVCEAVHHAHQSLVVHRDLKPSNIIVTKDGQPKLLDFGIAKLMGPDLAPNAGSPTAPEMRVMTPEYASPEQVLGMPVTTATDVYALGVLLYELVSGHRPFQFTSRARAELERVICEQEPERPSTAISRVDGPRAKTTDAKTSGSSSTLDTVSRLRESRPSRLRRQLSGDIDNIVLMAMRKEPQRRYSSAQQLAEDITRHRAGRPVIARSDTMSYRVGKFVVRHRAGVAAAVLVMVAVTGGIVGTTMGWQKAEAERAVAERRFDQVRAIAKTFMYDFHDSIQELDGALPARELLVTKSLEYLDGLAQEVGDNDELKGEVADAYDHVGDLRGGIRNPSLGDTAGALANYEKALAMRKELAAARPDDDAVQKALSISHIKVADMYLHRGDAAGSLAAHQSALGIQEKRLARQPNAPDTRRDVATALGNVAATLVRTGDAAGAIEHYDRALALREKLATEQPDDATTQRELAGAYIRVGYELEQAGRPDDALGRYEAALRVRKRLADAAPDNGRRRRDLAVAHYYVGNGYLAKEQPEKALEHLAPNLEIVAQRAADNPTSARAKRDVAYTREMMGRAYAKLGDLALADQHYKAFQEIVVGLSEADRQNATDRALVALSHERLAETKFAAGNHEAAIAEAELALEIVEALSRADRSNVLLQEDHARLQGLLGRLETAAGELGAARRRLETAKAEYETLREGQPESIPIRTGLADTLHDLARAMIGLAEHAAALDLAQQARVLHPHPPATLLRDLARAHHLNGNDARALELVEEALGVIGEPRLPADRDLERTLKADRAVYGRD